MLPQLRAQLSAAPPTLKEQILRAFHSRGAARLVAGLTGMNLGCAMHGDPSRKNFAPLTSATRLTSTPP